MSAITTSIKLGKNQILETVSANSDPGPTSKEFLFSLKILYTLRSINPESINARQSETGKAAQTPSSPYKRGRRTTAGIRKSSCRLTESRKAGLAFPKAWNKIVVITFKPMRGNPKKHDCYSIFSKFQVFRVRTE